MSRARTPHHFDGVRVLAGPVLRRDFQLRLAGKKKVLRHLEIAVFMEGFHRQFLSPGRIGCNQSAMARRHFLKIPLR